MPTNIGDVVTWVPVVYTQTFATTVLDQLPGPLEGKIGTEKPDLPTATGRNSGAHGRENFLIGWWVRLCIAVLIMSFLGVL